MAKKSDSKNQVLIHDEVVRVPASKLKSNTWNPNKLPPLEKKSLEHGILTEGFISPIHVQKSSGMIIDGEHRFKVGKKLGMKEFPVIYLDIDDAQARKLTLALINRKGSAKDADVAQVLKDIQDIEKTSLAQLELETSLAQEELDKLLKSVDAEALVADTLGKGKSKKSSKEGDGDLDVDPDAPDGSFDESQIGGSDKSKFDLPITFFAPTISDRGLLYRLFKDKQTDELSFALLKIVVDYYLLRHPKKAARVQANLPE